MMIESATAGEGKTTVATHFARNLTRTGLRVLMVDCDFQRPMLHRLFGLKKKDGGLARALSRVLSDKISSGSLEHFSMADIFFLINLRKQNGRLTIRDQSKTQTMTAYFQDGRFLHLHNHNNPPANLLGNMLLTGGFITEDQLQDAMERNKRTGQPLGYILMNAGYISRDKLRGPLGLQTEENLQKLFSWKEGSFAFGNGKLSTYDKERILFGDDYAAAIASLGRLEGYSLLENEIFANITNGQVENLYVLPTGATSIKPIGQVNVALLSKFLEILKQRFDIILLDCPPLDAAAGNATLFQLADGIIFVIKAGHLSIKILNEAKAGIPEDKLIGAVLNQVKRKGMYYYYR
jgi:Mrp family chromosome partitioning ATPase